MNGDKSKTLSINTLRSLKFIVLLSCPSYVYVTTLKQFWQIYNSANNCSNAQPRSKEPWKRG